jgi:hypothetical protein
MSHYGICEVCGIYTIVTEHHKIPKGKQPALKKCKNNLIDLCAKHHYEVHHDKNGQILNKKIRLSFQNLLETLFDKEYFTLEEIQETLEITYNASYSLCKGIKKHKGIFYKREDIIRSAMSDSIISEEEARELNESTGSF